MNANWLGKFVYHVLPIRRKIVLENMKLAFGKRRSDAEIRELAQAFYGHIAQVLLENVRMTWMSDAELMRSVKVIGADIAIRAHQKGNGIIFMTGHFGNWELAPIGGVMQFPQFKNRFFILRRPIVNKWIEKLLFQRFYRCGLNIIPKRNSLDRVLDALEQKHAVTFIMDQYARPSKDGILAEFFGVKTGTFKSLALVAARTHAPVVPVMCFRDAKGQHVMRFFEPLKWIKHDDADAEILENTRQYNRTLEQMILSRPEQWLWFHRRWKQK